MPPPTPAFAKTPIPARRSLASWTWAIFVLAAIGFVVSGNRIRAQRVQYISNLPEWSVDDPTVDASSPTGYAAGIRRLIVSNHNNESFQWIAQTQQMQSRGEWRVRHVDYENAPLGREVHAASPYRWWLGCVAWIHHAITGTPLGQAVERAALFSDPALHLFLLLSATWFVACRFGALPASALAVGIVGLYPFGAGFVSGAPSHYGLIQAIAAWSLLPLFAGMVRAHRGQPNTSDLGEETRAIRRWFFVAGAFGGLGLWVSVAHQLPIVIGVAIGGVFAAWIGRRTALPASPESSAALPWRAWAMGGACISVTGYLLEYFPNNLSLRLTVNHPLFAVAWVGLGELLTQFSARIQRHKSGWTRQEIVLAVLGVVAVASLPAMMVHSHSRLFSQEGPAASRLTTTGGIVASSLSQWISRDGGHAPLWATVLPLALVVLAVILIFRGWGGRHRASIGLALGPVLVGLALATRQLWWWNLADAALLALAVVALAAFTESAARPSVRWTVMAALALLITPGIVQLWPKRNAEDPPALTEVEGESYIERDLAHWLAQREGSSGALVLAPPNLTTALCFFGGLRGLGTFNWENDEGTTSAVRMVSALSRDEALALLSSRGVTHLVLPSWETVLDEYAALGLRASVGSERFDQSFIGGLHRWDLPPWLQPVPYPLPAAAGADRSVVILKVVDEQDPSVAVSRLVEYFIEMQQLDRASAVSQELRRFPGDVGALATLTLVEAARGDATAATGAFNKLLPFVARAARRPMLFDRRVSLAIVLAQQKRADLAKAQVERCLTDVDEPRLRSLTTVSLYRLQLLCKLYGLQIGDPELRGLARRLVRPELRTRL